MCINININININIGVLFNGVLDLHGAHGRVSGDARARAAPHDRGAASTEVCVGHIPGATARSVLRAMAFHCARPQFASTGSAALANAARSAEPCRAAIST